KCISLFSEIDWFRIKDELFPVLSPGGAKFCYFAFFFRFLPLAGGQTGRFSVISNDRPNQ
ncbi:hypothetical protein, partial [Alistipes sp.]|uniref:hypothetical protein n=1 Tax=Alistipes sp. TaxID=1872444 RepID=UPI00284F70C4